MPDRDFTNVPLVEPTICPDIFANGIARVERLAGGCVRIVFFAEHRGACGQIERVVVANVVRPISTLVLGNALVGMAEEQPQSLAALQ